MQEFEDDDDDEINKPLDVRFVIIGLLMLISSLIGIVFTENSWTKYISSIIFLSSFFVMTKKDDRNNLS